MPTRLRSICPAPPELSARRSAITAGRPKASAEYVNAGANTMVVLTVDGQTLLMACSAFNSSLLQNLCALIY